MRIKNFYILPWDKRRLVKDSVLLQSGQSVFGGEIAGFELDVMVYGEVDIRYRGEHYYNPEEFPEKLKRFIRRQENIFLYDGNVDFEVCSNNWYEVVISFGDTVLETTIIDFDLHRTSEKEARSCIIEWLSPFIESAARYPRYDLVTWSDSQIWLHRSGSILVNSETDSEDGDDLDSACMVPRKDGQYALLRWPESQQYECRKGVLLSYGDERFVPVEDLVLPEKTPAKSSGPVIRIPNLDDMYLDVCEFVKAHQGEKGYIDTQDEENDTIYGFIFDEELHAGLEEIVHGVRWDPVEEELQVVLEPYMRTHRVVYSDDSFRGLCEDMEANAEWQSVKDSDVYLIPTLFSIAESIQQYVD